MSDRGALGVERLAERIECTQRFGQRLRPHRQLDRRRVLARPLPLQQLHDHSVPAPALITNPSTLMAPGECQATPDARTQPSLAIQRILHRSQTKYPKDPANRRADLA